MSHLSSVSKLLFLCPKNKMDSNVSSSKKFENERNARENISESLSAKGRMSSESLEEDEPVYSMDFSKIARRPEDGSITWNFLEFYHSYAYDCRRFYNLCVVTPNTIVFASGNLITFFNIEENVMWFKRGSNSKGIGHICRNHIFNHIAVAENGEDPLITIYQWPSMEKVTILRGGTTERYFRLSYSPDGLLLASQGGAPDYYITIWNWQESKIALRCKSFVQDIYNITFAQSVPGCLTTSGSGHIKFWKMSRTFTGQKLKGEIGKFGKTEISDVLAVYPMPDETVVSGCEWGNILLWDERLIKLEVCKKNREMTHANFISQFEYVNGELISIGMDGWIKFWFYETIDQANLPDTERFLEILPIYELQITEDETRTSDASMLISIRKRDFDDPESTFWYAQDGNGGIWLVDLSTTGNLEKPQKIFTCHAGPIVDMDTALWGPYVSSFDQNGHLHIYNYLKKKLIVVHKFLDTGSQIVWLPCEIEGTGSTLICAFGNGLIRMIAIDVQRADNASNIKGNYVRIIKVMKPHTMAINVMSFNIPCKLLVTASEDSTIFTYKIQATESFPEILPIGYIRIPSPATCLSWNPSQSKTLLIGCLKGDVVEVELTDKPLPEPITTYELKDINLANFKFQSVRSYIEREAIRQEQLKQKEERLAKRRQEMEQLIAENPHVMIDEETFLIDFHEDPPLPEIYIPPTPNRVLVAEYKEDGSIWILMSGYDAGYLYEYLNPLSDKSSAGKLIKSKQILDAQDTELRNCLFYKGRRYLFFTTEYGEIRVCKLHPEDETNFSDYWILPIHDYYNGHITKMLLNYEKKVLVTCGSDGNLFAFNIKDDLPDEAVQISRTKGFVTLPEKDVEDIEDDDYPSLEQVVTKAENDRILEEARQKKEKTLEIIHDLVREYDKIMARNKSLKSSQRISHFELDPRITEDLEEQLKEKMNLTRRKLEFKVEKSALQLKKLMDRFVSPLTCLPFAVRGILDTEKIVYSLREKKLDSESWPPEYSSVKTSTDQTDTGRIGEEVSKLEEEQVEEPPDQIENLLKSGYGKIPSGLEMQINHMATKYREQKAKEKLRKNEWDAIQAKKPDLSSREKADKELLEETRKTIGEYNLKQSGNPELAKQHVTASMKYKELLSCKWKLHNLREGFNSDLRDVRSRKKALQKEVLRLNDSLKKIHAEIPKKNVKPLPQVPLIDLDFEFPEHNLELEQYTTRTDKMKEVKKQRQSHVERQIIDPNDLEYEVLLLDESADTGEEIGSLSALVTSSMTNLKIQASAHSEILKVLNTRDSRETAFEREMKAARVTRKIYEQDCILSYIQSSYEDLDKELSRLEEHRLKVVSQSVYMELFILSLYEEFVILRECEVTETKLQQKVDDKARESDLLQQKIHGIQAKIIGREDVIKRLQTKIKDLATRFTVAVSDNKFHDFLQKIFKKKYSAKKEESVDLTTISSETSSDETESDDDSELGQMILDENVCPPGCDKHLYDMAFAMRESRYEYELQIREEQKEIEVLRKDVDDDTKMLKIVESHLKECEKEFQLFMIEKQKKLNDIDVTIVLKFHQLTHVTSAENPPQIKDCLVFDKNQLSNLYARVGVLQDETLALQGKLKNNQVHLNRIKQDCRYMESENKKLEEEIKEDTIKKFGQNLSIMSLHEAVLRRLIYEAKTDLRDATMDQQIRDIKRECDEKRIILNSLLQENTEKLSFLTVLEKEKAKLEKILRKTPATEDEMLRTESEHKKDLLKLERVLENQLEQKRLLLNDIKSLQVRTKTLPPICCAKNAQ